MSEDVLLPGGWRLWNQFAVRGAGFPADGVLRVVPEGIAIAADKFDPGKPLAGPEWHDFETDYAQAAVDTARTLQEIAAAPDYQSAVVWQNRAVLERVLHLFLDWEPTAAGRTSKHRQREELLAQYWQRFCVKNDTIGFFGPVGWGGWDLRTRGAAVDPGTGLIAESTVYFASWAIDTVAARLGEDPALREWVAPRRVPFVRLAGDSVVVPGRPPQPLTSDQRIVLELCDGVRPAREISGLAPHADVPAILADLVKRRWLVWRLEVPAGARPEHWLRGWLERVGDQAVRAPGLELLDVLGHGRDEVGAASDPAELVRAMAALEDEFVARTDEAAAREKSAGTAPCRQLVYSDAQRAATLTLGTDVLDALAPLDLLLTSACWLTSTLAGTVLAKARAVYERLRRQDLAAGGTGAVDLASCWFGCMPILHGEAGGDADAIQREFWQRWQEILDVRDGQREIRVSAADIATRVRQAFGERGPGWTTSRYLSPDILIAATDVEAIARGDFALVLGELHVAMNTLGASLYLNQHPDPATLFAEVDHDLPQARLFPMLPKEHRARLSIRVRQSIDRPRDYFVGLVDHAVDPARPRIANSADVLVEDRDGRLVTVLSDGAVFDLADVFSHVLTTLVVDRFRLLPEADRTPRVTVDKLVVARQTWRFAAGELGFAAEKTPDKTEVRRYVRARQWRAEHELPRFVFVVSPTEPRPFYVDFDSPLYTNLFVKAVRRLAREDPVARLVITEMLPTPEDAWLTDDQGRKYTSELRFVAVDPVSSPN